MIRNQGPNGTKCERIVMVLGMHRSGTSLCSHVLSVLGLDMTDDIMAHESNAKGHWERPEILAFQDRILEHLGRGYYSRNHALALPPGWWADPKIRAIRDEMAEFVRDRLVSCRRFGFKDPRTARLMPVWKEILADLDLEPRYVFCVRDVAQIARSIAQRDRFEHKDTEHRWVVYNAHAINAVAAQDVCIIPYEQWFADPRPILARLVDHLNLSWDPADPLLEQVASSVIDSALRHDAVDPEAQTRPITRAFHRLILESVTAGRFSHELRSMAADFTGFEQLIEPMQRTLMEHEVLQSRMQDQERALHDLRQSVAGLRAERDTLCAERDAALVNREKLGMRAAPR